MIPSALYVQSGLYSIYVLPLVLVLSSKGSSPVLEDCTYPTGAIELDG
jgi:hypothetical protein